jgi:hypothetical protein
VHSRSHLSRVWPRVGWKTALNANRATSERCHRSLHDLYVG